jgi:hypothetical protein
MRIRVAVAVVVVLAVGMAARPAQAQYRPKSTSDRATGETYHVEIAGDFWNPTPDITIRSDALGIKSDLIDFVNDLGIEKTKFHQIKVVLRPSTKSKFRFEYTPITYAADATIHRDLVFNGIRYTLALPVHTELEWKAYRFGYEYDFLYKDRGFFGVLFDLKYTDVNAQLVNVINTEFAEAKAPIPAIGAIGRVYVAPNISITGEFSGFPSGIVSRIDENSDGHYFDLDIYGTVNFTDHAGAQVGYRSFNVFYKVHGEDSGDLKLNGLYFGGLVRF